MTTSAPQKEKSDKSNISFQATDALRDRVEACRRQEGERSVSDVCRKALDFYLAAKQVAI